MDWHSSCRVVTEVGCPGRGVQGCFASEWLWEFRFGSCVSTGILRTPLRRDSQAARGKDCQKGGSEQQQFFFEQFQCGASGLFVKRSKQRPEFLEQLLAVVPKWSLA